MSLLLRLLVALAASFALPAAAWSPSTTGPAFASKTASGVSAALADEEHTYFVGELGAWVHNKNTGGTPTSINPANGWKTVTRQMSQGEVAAWKGRSTLPQPRNNAGSGRGRIDVSEPGGPPGGGTANPVTVRFDVPADAVQPIGNAGWGTIYNEGRAIPMQNFTVLP